MTTLRHFYWQPFNHAYGPWFRLFEIKDGISRDLVSGGRHAESLVQPDLDGVHWYWSVKFSKYSPKLAVADAKPIEGKKMAPKKRPALPELKVGGKSATKEEAMKLAEEAFVAGRPK